MRWWNGKHKTVLLTNDHISLLLPGLTVQANQQPLADTWVFYDNSGGEPRLVASGEHEQENVVFDQILWHTIQEKYGRRKK